jgi:hypothetical protein
MAASGSSRLEKLGIPVVIHVGGGFVHDVTSGAEDVGVPTMRYLEVKEYYWYIPAKESAPIAPKYLDQYIERMTTPATTAELNPAQLQTRIEPDITITGKNYSDAVEQMMENLVKLQMGDGLALIPPTREAVDNMLTGTSLDPKTVIGTPVNNKNGVATVEKIAINAVMAGASPKYLPVIIAAMEAFTDPNRDQNHSQASLGGFEICVWVSGPIVKELGFNTLDRIWTYGNRPQAALGRSVMLCRINLGIMWPALNDMARSRTVWHTNWTFAENTEAYNPWKPYGTTRKFAATDSTVSVSTVSGGTTSSYSGATAMDKVKSQIAYINSARAQVFGNFTPATANPSAHPKKMITVIGPAAAKELNAAGYDQQKLAEYIYDQTKVPYEELSDNERTRIAQRIQASKDRTVIFSDTLPADIIPIWEAGLKPGGKVPQIVKIEDDLHFIVMGLETDATMWGWTYMRAPYNWNSHGTAKIRGAKLTNAGK